MELVMLGAAGEYYLYSAKNEFGPVVGKVTQRRETKTSSRHYRATLHGKVLNASREPTTLLEAKALFEELGYSVKERRLRP